MFVCILFIFCASALAQSADFALTTQRTLISSFPINRAPLVATHNSYSTAGYASLFPNQDLNFTAQLDLGVRWLELDLHYITQLASSRQGGYRLCHASSDIYNACSNQAGWNLCAILGIVDYGEDTGCADGAINFAQAFSEISAWKQRNPREVVIFYFDDHISTSDYTIQPNINSDVNGLLSTYFGSSIYTPADLAADGSWPTISSMTARGKTLLMTTSQNIFGGTYVHGDFRGILWPSSKVMYFSGYPRCTSTDPNYRATGNAGFRFFQEDLSQTLFGTTVIYNGTANVGAFSPETALGVMTCEYTVFLDYISSASVQQQLVWSWDVNQPSNGQLACASIQYSRGRWMVENCNSVSHRFACRSNANSTLWVIGSSSSTRANYTGDVCPNGYSFAVPRTARENLALRIAIINSNTNENVWISYNRYPNGTWSENYIQYSEVSQTPTSTTTGGESPSLSSQAPILMPLSVMLFLVICILQL